jgi:hypothetical protein
LVTIKKRRSRSWDVMFLTAIGHVTIGGEELGVPLPTVLFVGSVYWY